MLIDKLFVFVFYCAALSLLLCGCNSEKKTEPNQKQTLVVDSNFVVNISNPHYKNGKGSVVYFDDSHNNYNKITNTYKPFADLLQADGYSVKPFNLEFKKGTLRLSDILIIADPLNSVNVNHWIIPNPSAFTPNEINYLNSWVKNGGSLLLIASHMPFAGASANLAASFGFKFYNGYAKDTTGKFLTMFYKSDKTLASNFLTKNIDSIASFTGQAFDIPPAAFPLLILNSNHVVFMPDTAGVFHTHTATTGLQNGIQGAILKYGKGRVAVFGESEMFTAKILPPQNIKIGLNNLSAKQNKDFILNVIRWLDNEQTKLK